LRVQMTSEIEILQFIATVRLFLSALQWD